MGNSFTSLASWAQNQKDSGHQLKQKWWIHQHLYNMSVCDQVTWLLSVLLCVLSVHVVFFGKKTGSIGLYCCCCWSHTVFMHQTPSSKAHCWQIHHPEWVEITFVNLHRQNRQSSTECWHWDALIFCGINKCKQETSEITLIRIRLWVR